MDRLSLLPAEVIFEIFESCEYIDDAENLALCCKHLNSFFAPLDHRDRILRKIIVSITFPRGLRHWKTNTGKSKSHSDIYSPDIQLCHFVDTNTDYAAHHKFNSHPETHLRPNDEVFMRCFNATIENTTPRQLRDLQKRRKSLRILLDLYLNTSIQRQYSTSLFPYEVVDDRVRNLVRHSQQEGPLDKSGWDISKPSLPRGLVGEALSAEQERKFINALTACWLHVEVYCLAKHSNYRTASENHRMFEKVEELWTGVTHERTLLQQLHILEVYDFVYGFLLRKIFFDKSSMNLWLSVDRDKYLDSDTSPNDFDWDYFVNDARLHLRPLDITSLTITGPPPDESERIRYLISQGMFDDGGKDLSDGRELSDANDRDSSPDGWFTLRDLENGVLDIMCYGGLACHCRSKILLTCHMNWGYFRENWPKEARGTLFTQSRTDEEMSDQLQTFWMEAPAGEDKRSSELRSPRILLGSQRSYLNAVCESQTCLRCDR